MNVETITYEDTIEAAPVAADAAFEPAPDDRTAAGLVELIIRNPGRVDALLRDEGRQADLIPRFVGIALAGFTLFGVAATVVLNLSGARPGWVPSASWSGRSVANLTLAYDFGLIAATGVCLPSFYFYGLLAGVRVTMLQVAAFAMRCAATSAVALVGILPIYVAVALGVAVFDAGPEWREGTLLAGLALPFAAGLWGVRALYLGFVRLAEALPPARRRGRGAFLGWLTLAWSACYSVVTPVMIYSLWRGLSG